MTSEDWNKIAAAVGKARRYGGTLDADDLIKALIEEAAKTAAKEAEAKEKADGVKKPRK